MKVKKKAPSKSSELRRRLNASKLGGHGLVVDIGRRRIERRQFEVLL